jgi:molecular chaperone IbpA
MNIKVPNIFCEPGVWSDMLTDLHRIKFPHMDIVKHEDGKLTIDVALAGYKKKDIEVTLNKNVLEIEGNYPETGDKYLMDGIAKRYFKRHLPLAEHIEVEGVTMKDGILSVALTRNVPEEMKPITFKVE